MLLVTPQSMTHVDEDEIKHVLILPNLTSVVIEVDVDLSDF